MGGRQSKITEPTANLFNEIEITQEAPNSAIVEVTLIMITVLLGLNLALKIYGMHIRRLKRRYLNRMNSVEKI